MQSTIIDTCHTTILPIYLLTFLSPLFHTFLPRKTKKKLNMLAIFHAPNLYFPKFAGWAVLAVNKMQDFRGIYWHSLQWYLELIYFRNFLGFFFLLSSSFHHFPSCPVVEMSEKRRKAPARMGRFIIFYPAVQIGLSLPTSDRLIIA